MKKTPWADFVPVETSSLYETAGFGHRVDVGQRPALLVIDVQYATTGENPVPLNEAIRYHPMNCGAVAWEAMIRIQRLIEVFRSRSLPILYPYVAPRKNRDKNRRMPLAAEFNSRHWEIVEGIAPLEQDVLIPKTGPSAFFGTALVSHLIRRGADTLFLVGNTTSGCVRASATDAYALGYKTLVVSDGVYDRSAVSHAVSLFDIHSKYAEVIECSDAIARIEESLDATGR